MLTLNKEADVANSKGMPNSIFWHSLRTCFNSENGKVICFTEHPNHSYTALLAQPMVWVWGAELTILLTNGRQRESSGNFFLVMLTVWKSVWHNTAHASIVLFIHLKLRANSYVTLQQGVKELKTKYTAL